ncbi:MAG: hypothetical protein Q9168_007993 [Polycauliona sp. 1 TL-2023]
MGASPTSRRPYSIHQREASPATSFLEKFGLGTDPNTGCGRSEVAENYKYNHIHQDQNHGHDSRSFGEVWDNHTLKRSAVSPVEEPQQEANKRLRHDNLSPYFQAQHQTYRYADAATQTGLLETTAAKLAQLRAEGAAAKAKHEAEMNMAQLTYEAEDARRRQVMAEVEYQSKMAALRQLSEVSSNKGSMTASPSATRSASAGMPESLRQQNAVSRAVVDRPSAVKEPVQSITKKAHVEAAPVSQSPKIGRGTESETTYQHEKKAPLAPAPRRSQEGSTTANGPVKQASVPEISRANGLVKAPTGPDKSKAAPPSPARGRAESSGSHSVQIKTSGSPAAKARARPPYEIPFGPSSSLKHLTCYFWKNTVGCNKSATECNYAHYDTGVTASDPGEWRHNHKRW